MQSCIEVEHGELEAARTPSRTHTKPHELVVSSNAVRVHAFFSLVLVATTGTVYGAISEEATAG